MMGMGGGLDGDAGIAKPVLAIGGAETPPACRSVSRSCSRSPWRSVSRSPPSRGRRSCSPEERHWQPPPPQQPPPQFDAGHHPATASFGNHWEQQQQQQVSQAPQQLQQHCQFNGMMGGAASNSVAGMSTLSGMLSAGRQTEGGSSSSSRNNLAGEENAAQNAARKAAAGAAAAAFAQQAARVAETSRDAARDAATAKAATPLLPDESDGWGRAQQRRNAYEPETDGFGDMSSRHWHTDMSGASIKPPVRLWLPEPSEAAIPEQHSAPPPPVHQQQQQQQRGSRRSRSRSRSWGRKPPTPEIRRRRKRLGGGWDDEEAQRAQPEPQAPQGFSSAPPPTAQPSRPAVPPGMKPSPMPPGGVNVPVNRFGIHEATPEALAAAVFRAQQVEAAGLEAIRNTGQIPRGPPDLPTGTEVIEQKCVAYLIGKGGQALAAINAAAGVSIQIDQSTKGFGWSMANIYGTEEGAAKANNTKAPHLHHQQQLWRPRSRTLASRPPIC